MGDEAVAAWAHRASAVVGVSCWRISIFAELFFSSDSLVVCSIAGNSNVEAITLAEPRIISIASRCSDRISISTGLTGPFEVGSGKSDSMVAFWSMGVDGG